ncbi:large subunit ribosomal protein L18e [Babesia microti strain RI]|uniref:Large subunit ribosomal protein L18e n=1 Tax=Babesia microti (strain RI) TaxID=1133968 RepID=I7JCG7_BABMR|nr:large subunit ribosomal protein L18e [Babesia microti strain RI]CCF75175.2 large subunit ribosomal protein L18e [Babesia microti strain RI]|eukprot:XP_021337160.1 large subunit ribosomal protein L18e [Babesia microti strain RI]
MGIDLKDAGRKKKSARKTITSPNPYMRLLVKLYKFLSRRTNGTFNKIILKRLIMARRFKAPLSLSKLAKHMANKPDSVAVVVGTITDDIRLYQIPKLRVCALRFTENANKRIIAAGGECFGFDQLATRYPTGKQCILFRGATKSREAEKHFGKAPGTPGSHTKPYVRSKGRKFEKARGRRKSRGFKV